MGGTSASSSASGPGEGADRFRRREPMAPAPMSTKLEKTVSSMLAGEV